ncbi:MAG: hypothetical protein HYU54_04850 [Actinobacteria bacterium]|nr:hypothetical protein [Actinomycetota bacterium]
MMGAGVAPLQPAEATGLGQAVLTLAALAATFVAYVLVAGSRAARPRPDLAARVEETAPKAA